MKKKTIIYIIDGLGIGGAERLMIPLLENLDKELFNVRVCVLQSKDGNPLADDILAIGIPVDFLNVKRLRDITAIFRLRTYLKNNHADIVHTQLEFANILGNIAAKFLRLPSVCTVHVLPEETENFKDSLHQKIEWTTLQVFCDRVYSVSEEARSQYIDLNRISASQILTIYNGIDLVRFNRLKPDLAQASVREEFGLPKDSNLIITVAVLRPPKGIEYMIRALPNIRSSHPNTYYLIVGDGAHRNFLTEETEKTGMKGAVIFSGKRKDISRLLSASDIFVLPTLTEALPTVLAEAMVCQLPIVASRVGGIPEMVQHNENGLLVSPAHPQELADACNTLLSNASLRKKIGLKGETLVRNKFNVIKQVRQLEQQYIELISSYEK